MLMITSPPAPHLTSAVTSVWRLSGGQPAISVAALPTDNIGARSFPTGFPVSAVAGYLGFIAVDSGVLISKCVPPGIFRNFSRHVGAVPLVDVSGLDPQR